MAEQRVTDEQLGKLARQPWLAYQSDTVLDLVADLRASRARETRLIAMCEEADTDETPRLMFVTLLDPRDVRAVLTRTEPDHA